MQNRSNRGSGKPVWVKAHQARAFDWDPIRRIALGPAAMCAASTGRTHDSTRPTCIDIKTALAKREPSTHDLGHRRPDFCGIWMSLQLAPGTRTTAPIAPNQNRHKYRSYGSIVRTFGISSGPCLFRTAPGPSQKPAPALFSPKRLYCRVLRHLRNSSNNAFFSR
jgi:hypothetical protein